MTRTVERSGHPTPAVLDIRRKVFIDEQGIPEDVELDGTDPGFVHWLLRDDGIAVATLRTKIADGVVKIGRVATLGSARGRGHARHLMQAALDAARAEGATRAYLSAQQDVLAWYARFGFTGDGAFYDDGGIPHRDMWADL
ncbi:MAG: GNAT family N-acetyltransferase [Pseudomonadota bacterium]